MKSLEDGKISFLWCSLGHAVHSIQIQCIVKIVYMHMHSHTHTHSEEDKHTAEPILSMEHEMKLDIRSEHSVKGYKSELLIVLSFSVCCL